MTTLTLESLCFYNSLAPLLIPNLNLHIFRNAFISSIERELRVRDSDQQHRIRGAVLREGRLWPQPLHTFPCTLEYVEIYLNILRVKNGTRRRGGEMYNDESGRSNPEKGPPPPNSSAPTLFFVNLLPSPPPVLPLPPQEPSSHVLMLDEFF